MLGEHLVDDGQIPLLWCCSPYGGKQWNENKIYKKTGKFRIKLWYIFC